MSPESGVQKKVRVELGPRSYDVLIGKGILGGLGEEMSGIGLKGPIALISDSSVYALGITQSLLRSFHSSPFHYLGMGEAADQGRWRVPPGEKSKTLSHAEDLLSELAAQKVPRTGTIVALGGGVIGDLAGFVAAIYLRGINFVQVPTTLLAMVDSSVGGKTGVNLREGKNLVGAFHQPKWVVADLDTLETLPPREFAAGMAEVIKYGAIKGQALFDRVAGGVKPTDPDLADIIARCVEIKARIVEQDEFETKGLRALLNFGHTIGHAIEKVGKYERHLHGEAIALGMRAAAWLSVSQAGLPESDALRLEAALISNGLVPILDRGIDREDILGALGNDKKVAVDGQNRWVLLKNLGEATADRQISSDLVEDAVDRLYQPIAAS